MSGKIKTVYVCTECGEIHKKWHGQCNSCKAWNTLEEERQVDVISSSNKVNKFSTYSGQQISNITNLANVNHSTGSLRFSSNIKELDRVLGGGLVTGSVIILGGDPGAGKSTLLLQVCEHVAKENKKALYISAEESLEQIKDRAERLNLDKSYLDVYIQNKLESIIEKLQETRPNLVIIDSIQTIYTDQLTSSPGSVSQVKDCSAFLTRIAKELGITIILVGQVTKDGTLAGPKVFEHIVDVSLFFEGDSQSSFRIVRALKNRYGSVNEIGVFEMTSEGMISVDNPSAMFLSLERKSASGSTVFIMQEGQRPILIEIQALVDESNFGQPRRSVVGLDYNRLSMILAVLHKHGGLSCGDQDVYINAVGGAKVLESASDLAVCFSIISSIRNLPLSNNLACFGEIGLTGEVRPVLRAEERIKEAKNMGFKNVILPNRNLPKKPIPGINCIGVSSMSEALNALSDFLER